MPKDLLGTYVKSNNMKDEQPPKTGMVEGKYGSIKVAYGDCLLKPTHLGRTKSSY